MQFLQALFSVLAYDSFILQTGKEDGREEPNSFYGSISFLYAVQALSLKFVSQRLVICTENASSYWCTPALCPSYLMQEIAMQHFNLVKMFTI